MQLARGRELISSFDWVANLLFIGEQILELVDFSGSLNFYFDLSVAFLLSLITTRILSIST